LLGIKQLGGKEQACFAYKGHEQQHKSPVSTVPTSAKNSGTVSLAPASTKDSIC
jgi:hypothetical protein